MPDFLTMYYAAVCTLRDGDADSIEVAHTIENEHGTSTLCVTIRRAELTIHIDADADEPVDDG